MISRLHIPGPALFRGDVLLYHADAADYLASAEAASPAFARVAPPARPKIGP